MDVLDELSHDLNKKSCKDEQNKCIQQVLETNLKV